MNLLIVDDEIYIVRALQKNIHWGNIGITNVFIAFNVEKAKEIFQTCEIDILITDIEMPRESGLDLIEWVRERNGKCKMICLTCHSEFQYAQKAIRYQVSDYIIKPVVFSRLEEVVSKVVSKLEVEEREREEISKGVFWGYHQSGVEIKFWECLLREGYGTDMESLSKKAGDIGIAWDFNQQYQLVLFSIKRIFDRQIEWKENTELMKYIMYNISCDIFVDGEMDKAGWIRDDQMWVILSAEITVELTQKAEKFITLCEQLLGVAVVGYLDDICYGEELHQSYIRLEKQDKENVFQEKGIYDFLKDDSDRDFAGGFYKQLRTLLREKKFRESKLLIGEMWNDKKNVSSESLIVNIGAGQYEILRWMEENGIAAEHLWKEALLKDVDKLYHSASMYKEWLAMAVERIEELDQDTREEKKATVQIRKYVAEHIEEKISREDVAKSVNFSIDYISKLFKKEMGISLSEYIMKQKVLLAQELIIRGEESIGDIAVRLGYSSFSYFSEIFRRFTGVLPSEYKRTQKPE